VGQLSGRKKERPELLIGVTGCMAQRMGDELLAQAPSVDLVMGPDGYRSLPLRLRELREAGAAVVPAVRKDGAPARRSSKRRIQLAVLEFDPRGNYEGLELRRSAGALAWVP